MAQGTGTIRAAARTTLLVTLAGGCSMLAHRGEGTFPTAGSERSAAPLHGFASLRYRPRWTSDDSDHDLYAVVSLDAGDPSEDALTAHVMGRVAWDLDGRDAQDGSEVFGSIEDTYEERVNGQLLHAYVDAHRLGDGLERLRLGRQRVWRTPETVVFDGLSAVTRRLGPRNLRAGAYGGIPTHYHEASSAGDSLVGLFVEGSPWDSGSVRLDWMHLEDQRRLGDFANDLFGVRARERLLPNTLLEGAYSRLEGQDRDVMFRAAHTEPENDLAVSIRYYELLEPQRELALEFDPFVESLRTYFPYWQTTASVSKGVGEYATLEAGVDVRRVSDDADIGDFNRDYERYFLSASVEEVSSAALRLSATGDAWRSDGLDTTSLGLDVSKAFSDRCECSIGTYYSLFKYDPFLDDERQDVRTYYVRLRLARSRNIALRGSYEFEDDEFETYHVVKLGATWRF